MNSVQLIGRATATPEVRFAPSGTAVCNMTVALDDSFGDSKKTFFFAVTLFGKTAETAGKYVTKGQRVGITGKLSQDAYTPKGQDKPITKTHVIGNLLDLLDRPAGSGGGEPPQRQSNQAPPMRKPATGADGQPHDFDDEDGDIPF